MEIGVREARASFSHLIQAVESGEDVTILKHGKKIARIIPIESNKSLPSLREFRKSIHMKGKTVTETILENRKDERY